MVTPVHDIGEGEIAAARPLPGLAGLRILIVEDDYYLAMEAKAVLARAGAVIIGPFPNDDDVRRALTPEAVDCAIVDINLGWGPSFAAAERLEALGVPYFFLTGYDTEAIPARFRHVPQTRKPTKDGELVKAVRAVCRL